MKGRATRHTNGCRDRLWKPELIDGLVGDWRHRRNRRRGFDPHRHLGGARDRCKEPHQKNEEYDTYRHGYGFVVLHVTPLPAALGNR